MRLLSGFFADLPNMRLFEYPEAFTVKINPKWIWFFLRDRQLLLFLQDPTHLVTKWRNRMLSKTSNIIMGQQSITIQHLFDIINDPNLSKIDHGLVLTDINPKDRQNFASCLKITSDDVMKVLHDNSNTQATYLYLRLLRYSIIPYIEKTTSIADRLYYSWLVVFVCRFWLIWIRCKTFIDKTTNKKQNFIMMPAYWSVELNAHTMVYLVILVQQHQLPVEILNMYLFNSQGCESIFRNARALSGTFSSRINFTVDDFLPRAEKLSLLQLIKCEEQSSKEQNHLIFPVHHKNKEDYLLPSQRTININQLNVEKIILKAYNQVQQLIEDLKMSRLLQQNNAYELKDLSATVKEYFKTTSKLINRTKIDSHPLSSSSGDDDVDYDDDASEEDQENEQGEEEHEENDNEDFVSSEDNDEDNEDNKPSVTTRKTTFNGMRLYDTINSNLKNSYFEVKINKTKIPS